MRRGTTFTYLFAVCILAFASLLGVWGFRGSPFLESADARLFVRPDWTAGIAAPSTYPAYNLSADGTAVPVGRAILLDDGRVEMRLFPDLKSVSFDGARVVFLETDVKALWSLVPRASKDDIALVGERLVSVLRDRFVAMIGQPAFTEDYRKPLQRIVEDAYIQMWRDPKMQLIKRTVRDMFDQNDGERLAAALLPIALPKLRSAVFEMMLPSWQSMHDLVVDGKMDTRPLEQAAAQIMVDPEVQRLMVRHLFDIAEDDRAWRVGALMADAFLDAMTADPRLQPLVDKMLRDPRFARELRMLETELSAMSMEVFSRIVERSNGRPDTLAVRVIRYILLNRRRLVALVVPDGSPAALELTRYEPLVEIRS
ncbi:hypothetical protein [Thalassobaculum sp.]|uniref:hypothetical protein n=1 Tax=Thalassobaculum sp. TaxID=2022740 RepID=UPI0032EF49CC